MTAQEDRLIVTFPPALRAIADIVVGDIVLLDDRLRTVGRKDIARGGFMGDRLFGVPDRFGRVKFMVLQGLQK